MTTTYKDYKICTNLLCHPMYGNGFRATIYIPKTDGTKADVRELSVFGKRFKTHKHVVDYAKKIIDLNF